MKAKKEHQTGTCVKCKTENVPLVGTAAKLGGSVCDQCFTEIRQTGLAFDQFDLKPDELTVEMLMDKAGFVTRRTIQNWNKDGRLPYTMERRRINGTIRKQVIYQSADVDTFLEKENQVKVTPAIVREKSENANGGEKSLSKAFANGRSGLMEMLAQVMSQATRPATSPLFGCPALKRLTVDGAAVMACISKTQLRAAVRDAENRGTIQRFSGPKGSSVYIAEQLEFVIQNIPPTPKRLPPAAFFKDRNMIQHPTRPDGDEVRK
jgi:hypothetical protein